MPYFTFAAHYKEAAKVAQGITGISILTGKNLNSQCSVMP
jgi:hypothetical protein